MLEHMNPAMRAFIGRQEMMFVATADGRGHAHSSFRAGHAGFVKILDERTLAYPEYRGNGVMSSLGNLAENPHVGLTFIDFQTDRIGLHVNGRARIVENDELRGMLKRSPDRSRGAIGSGAHEPYECRSGKRRAVGSGFRGRRIRSLL
jgi:uncharacterized protein